MSVAGRSSLVVLVHLLRSSPTPLQAAFLKLSILHDSTLPKDICLGAAMTVRCSGTLLGKLSGQHLATSAGVMPIYILQELARLYKAAWRMNKSSTHSPFANCK